MQRGDLKRISEKSGKDYSYVFRVLSPKKSEYSEDIINAAISVIQERKAKAETMINNINVTI